MKVEEILKIKLPISVICPDGTEETAFGICIMDDYMFTGVDGSLLAYVKDCEIYSDRDL